MKCFMLTEQYRMHPSINEVVSKAFYFSKLKTSDATRKARMHPIPASFVNVARGRSEFNEGSCFNRDEANEVVRIASHAVKYLGMAQERVNILTFYNAQRDLLEKEMIKQKLKGIAVVSGHDKCLEVERIWQSALRGLRHFPSAKDFTN